MNNHYITKEIKDRLYSCMRSRFVSSSDLCRILNVEYPDLKATLDGKSPLYNKWQKKIADALNVDKKDLFKEWYEPKLTEEEIRADERANTIDEILHNMPCYHNCEECAFAEVAEMPESYDYYVKWCNLEKHLKQMKGGTK